MIRLFRIDGIDARRFVEPENAPKEIRIDNNSTVMAISRINEKEARVEFKFTISYSGIGMINFEGIVIYEGNATQLSDEWTKKHRMPDEVAQEIHGTIINSCVLEAVLIAKELRLPPPIPPPAQIMQQNKDKKHKSGPIEGYA